MRQRVSIRALIHQPSMLLMDEPFGALDAITRTQIRHDLELLWMETRKTVLFITHSVEEAVGLSDRVLVMSPNPGRIVEEIAIDLPRPRPAHLGEDPSFNAYAERIHARVSSARRLQVLRLRCACWSPAAPDSSAMPSHRARADAGHEVATSIARDRPISRSTSAIPRRSATPWRARVPRSSCILPRCSPMRRAAIPSARCASTSVGTAAVFAAREAAGVGASCSRAPTPP